MAMPLSPGPATALQEQGLGQLLDLEADARRENSFSRSCSGCRGLELWAP